jgi:hypothetical protein
MSLRHGGRQLLVVGLHVARLLERQLQRAVVGDVVHHTLVEGPRCSHLSSKASRFEQQGATQKQMSCYHE